MATQCSAGVNGTATAGLPFAGMALDGAVDWICDQPDRIGDGAILDTSGVRRLEEESSQVGMEYSAWLNDGGDRDRGAVERG